MASPNEYVRAPVTDPLAGSAEGFFPPLDEEAGEPNLFQEINERRARLENAELLRRLRGL